MGIMFKGAGESLLSRMDSDVQLKYDSTLLQIEKVNKAISNLYSLVEDGDREAIDRIKQRKQEKNKLEMDLIKIRHELTESREMPSLFK